MNKPVDLGLSIMELSKIVMPKFWYNYVKPKYCEKAKLFYMDADSFIVCIKTGDIYKNIAEDAETRFPTSNYELERRMPKGKNKKVIGLMNDQLGGKIMIELVGLKAKTYSYLIDDGKKSKTHKKVYHKKT